MMHETVHERIQMIMVRLNKRANRDWGFKKESTYQSDCMYPGMIMGATAASSVYNFQLKSPIVDYDLALVFQPMLMLGISIGVIFNVIFPNWIVTILLIVLFTGMSIKINFQYPFSPHICKYLAPTHVHEPAQKHVYRSC